MKPAKDSKLFTDFPDISTNAWEEKIKADLNGADYQKKLFWNSDEGIRVKPFYRADDLTSLEYLENLGTLRADQPEPNGWNICQDIWIQGDPNEANRRIRIALDGGAQAIRIHLEDQLPLIKESLDHLMKDISFDRAQWIFEGPLSADSLLETLAALAKERKTDLSQLNVSLGADPLGKMTETGIPIASMENVGRLAERTMTLSPAMRLLELHGGLIHNSGGNLVEELAFSLSMAVDYMDVMTQSGIDPSVAHRLFRWNLAAGPNYFMEISKLRAARLLWAKLVEGYGVPPAEGKIQIHSTSSQWNLTLYDPYTNMLRGTTEAMSSILGGADLVSVLPFDYLFGKTSEFSERISRNVQIILREESYFGRVSDPAAGSYYVESLTNSMGESAWDLFRQVEQMGGYRKAFESGWIQQRVKASREKKLEKTTGGRQKIVGTNAYPDYHERMLDHLKESDRESPPAMEDQSSSAIHLPSLKPFRPASLFEKIRLETEKSGKRPRVMLFKYGNPGWASARATFSGNFFACAGYEIVDQPPVTSFDQGIQLARKTAPDVIVLCSADETYAELAPGVQKAAGEKSLVVVAGNPVDDMDTLRSAGIEHFIHMRTNLLESLQQFNNILL